MANLPIQKVKNLYYKEGLSAREVGENLGVSIDVVYKFMRKHSLSRRDLFEQNRVRFERKPLSFKIKKRLNKEEEKLKIAGIMLYWAEGSKLNVKSKRFTVDFTNSNPVMIKIFLRFLRHICRIGEHKLRAYLYCYANQNVDHLIDYWHKLSNIPLKQFTKPYIRKDFSLSKRNKMKYGLIHIRYSDKRLLLQIEKWIEQYLNKAI